MFINKPEIIEQYITGKLTGEELIQFQNELHKDPILQSEVALQKEIIHSVQQFRKLQLKQRMDNIAVSAGNSYTGLKVAASIVLAGLVTFGVFNYNLQQKVENFNNQSITPINNQKNEQTDNLDSSPEIAKSNSAESLTNKESLKPVTNVIKPKELSIKNSESTVIATVPNADYHNGDEHLIKDGNVTLPKGELAQGNGDHTLKAEVIVDDLDKSRFHYKYFSGKLFLYGEFANPYELLEWNSAEGKKLFLKYNSEYYKIKDNQMEPIKLEKIMDKKLLNELRQISK